MTGGIGSIEVVISIGSNCGDRKENVAEGIRWISSVLTGLRSSDIYATPDCHGGKRQYMNAVVTGTTDMTLNSLDMLCKDHEKMMGRDEKARAAGDIPVDIDIVLYDGIVMREADYRSEFFKIGFERI